MGLVQAVLVLLALPIAFRFPVYGLCLYVWFDTVSPQTLFPGILSGLRYSLVIALVSFVGALFFERPWRRRGGATFWWLVVFFAWSVVTTTFAELPDPGWEKWAKLAKNLAVVLLLARLVDSRERLEMLAWAMFVSAGILGLHGAVVTLATGGGGLQVVGPPGSHLGERNALSIALLIAIPIGVFLFRRATVSPPALAKPIAGTLIAAACIAVIGGQSRGALIGAAGMLTGLLIVTQRKILVATSWMILLAALALLAPPEWYERMATIESYGEDKSATSRLTTWMWGLDVALARPIVGGGMGIYHSNTDSGIGPWLDSHSIYFELLAEHGFVGAGIFLALLLSVAFTVGRLRRIARRDQDLAWLSDLAATITASQLVVLTAGAFAVMTPHMMTYYPALLAMIASSLSRSVPAALPSGGRA